MTALTIKGEAVENATVGTLRTADINGDLGEQLRQDGYLFLRNLHDPDSVEAARLEVLTRLGEVGEVSEPINLGIASNSSRRREIYPETADLGAFWRSVSDGKAVRAVINGPRIIAAMSRLFDEPATHFSFAWLRAMTAGRASPLHIDHPYMNRGSQRLVTCWSPLCTIARRDGPLYILEGSHHWADIRKRFEGHDVDRDPKRPGHLEESPMDLVQRKHSQFLTSDFKPGDCLVFGMFTVHGSFDNNTQSGQIRLSCDTRFQPAADAMDERFCGPDPQAHGGLGYGCLSASLPLTETGTLR